MSTVPPRPALLAVASSALVALALYVFTAAPDLTLVDSGELALAAATGGVAHPPGFPLFLLVGRLFSALPFATPARWLNLMSAFFVAGACGAVLLSVERMLSLLPAGDSGPRRRIAAACVAAVAFGTGWNPWVWSAVTEVYALNLFLVAAAWACAWGGVAAWSERAGNSPVAWRWFTAAAVLAALPLANHHATGGPLLPVLLGMVAWAAPRALRTRRFWITAIAAVAGSLSLYLYLFVASRNDSALNWGHITSWSLLWRHVTGAQYSLQVGSSEEEATRVARLFFTTLVTGVGWIPAALVGIGIGVGVRTMRAGRSASTARPAKRPRRAGALVLLAPLALIALNLALSTFYVVGPEDRMAYDLPATVAWCLLAGAGAWALLGARRWPRTVVALGLAVLVGGLNVAHHFGACQLRHEGTARRFVQETLRDVPPGSVLFSAEWNFYAPYLYVRTREHFRPDVRVIDVLMMRRFWYMDYLVRAYPELIAATREPFDAFRSEITRFDLGQPYDATTIQQKYDRLIGAWISFGLEHTAAFADGACYEHPQEQGWLRSHYTVPDGLLVRFLENGAPVDQAALEPFDATNLRYLRSRITARSVERDLSDLPERNHPYYRVWQAYESAVEASLLVAARSGPDAVSARAAAYRAWFPEVDRALAHVKAIYR